MAEDSKAAEIVNSLSCLILGSSGGNTERNERFWNASTVAMKFSVEKLWLGAVWKCQRKPNYGMRELDGILEERAGNKLELTGPLIDSYLRELGKSIMSKLGRSRNTGLMPPVKLFVPYPIFRHIMNVVVGYGAKMTNNNTTISLRVDSYQAISRMFSPARFEGNNFLRKRHFSKSNENVETFSSTLAEQPS